MLEDRTTFTGIVRGRIIELDDDPNLVPGQRVIVELAESRGESRGEGIRASAGAWADAGVEFDEWLRDVYRGRRIDFDRPRE
jgi:hypothetical protein